MEEIAQYYEKLFRQDLQAVLDMFKDKLSVPCIMHVAQDVFHKTLSIRYHPELHNVNFKEINGIKVLAELLEEPNPEFKKMLQGEFKCID